MSSIPPVSLVNPVAPYVSPSRATRVAIEGANPTYSFANENIVPVANPTDLFAVYCGSEGKAVSVKRIEIQAVATSAAVLDLRVQLSVNGGTGGYATPYLGKHNLRDTTATAILWEFTGNRNSLGNGISSQRPLLRTGKLFCGPLAADCRPLVFDFGTRGSRGINLQDLVTWLVVNLNGQALPAGFKYSYSVEVTEEPILRTIMAGDSTYSQAIELFQTIWDDPGLNGWTDIRNYGSNGFRLTDYINNTNGVLYPQTAALTANPDRLGIGYALNDLRQGATTQAQLAAMLVTAVTATLAARPDCRILLHGPNSVLTDDPSSAGYITLTGLFSGQTLAQAAQNVTDWGYGAYQDAYAQLLAATPALAAQITLIQRQDVFGRTAGPAASRPLMLDTLHPNARGRVLAARQILPWLRAA